MSNPTDAGLNRRNPSTFSLDQQKTGARESCQRHAFVPILARTRSRVSIAQTWRVEEQRGYPPTLVSFAHTVVIVPGGGEDFGSASLSPWTSAISSGRPARRGKKLERSYPRVSFAAAVLQRQKWSMPTVSFTSTSFLRGNLCRVHPVSWSIGKEGRRHGRNSRWFVCAS